MKTLLIVVPLILSGILLSGCQPQASAPVSPTLPEIRQKVAEAKPQEVVDPEIQAMQQEFDKIADTTNFPDFSDQDFE